LSIREVRGHREIILSKGVSFLKEVQNAKDIQFIG
jgi:hypothetical protein